MESQKINLLVNIISFLDFSLCALTGFFMKSREIQLNFKGIHVFTGWILVFLVIVHIILHYSWIKSIPSFLKSKNGKRRK
jgi:cytochrome b561